MSILHGKNSGTSCNRSLSDIFADSQLSILTKQDLLMHDNNGTITNSLRRNQQPQQQPQQTFPNHDLYLKVDPVSPNNYTGVSFYQDCNTGRTRVIVPILLTCPNHNDRDTLIQYTNIDITNTDTDTDTDTSMVKSSKEEEENDKNQDIDEQHDNDNDQRKEEETSTSADKELWEAELATLGETRGDISPIKTNKHNRNDSVKEEEDNFNDKLMNTISNISFQCNCNYLNHKGEVIPNLGAGSSSSNYPIVEGVTILSSFLYADPELSSLPDNNNPSSSSSSPNNNDIMDDASICFELEILLLVNPCKPITNSHSNILSAVDAPTTAPDLTNSTTTDLTSTSINNAGVAKVLLDIQSILKFSHSHDFNDSSLKTYHYRNRDIQDHQQQQQQSHNNDNDDYDDDDDDISLEESTDLIEIGLSSLDINHNRWEEHEHYLLPNNLMSSSTTQSNYNSYNDNNNPNEIERVIMKTSPSLSLQPITVEIELVPALCLSIQEIGGASSPTGSTLVSLTMKHSNAHDEYVTITNIAFHSGQSKLYTSSSTSSNNTKHYSHNNPENADFDTTTRSEDMPYKTNLDSKIENFYTDNIVADSMTPNSIQDSPIINMSPHVRWGYASGTNPPLPLTLKPYEAFATVIQIHAGETVGSRRFVSPICVSAMIGNNNNIECTTSSDNAKDLSSEKEEKEKIKNTIMVSAGAKWTTKRIAIGPTDAFRVDMSLRETDCFVGAQCVVSLKFMNLSHQTKDLMLLMAKNNEGKPKVFQHTMQGPQGTLIGGQSVMGGLSASGHASSTSVTQSGSHIGVNSAVVSEVNGYTFGVWGVSGDDDGTVRYNRDHELLAIDAALLLGEVKGQHSMEAELRFVPLREGTLDVPNFKLYDKIGKQWYSCVHRLQIVAAAQQ